MRRPSHQSKVSLYGTLTPCLASETLARPCHGPGLRHRRVPRVIFASRAVAQALDMREDDEGLARKIICSLQMSLRGR